MAAVWMDARLERSHSMKVSLVEGDVCWTLLMSSLARFWFLPLKKMCAGFCAAKNEIDSAPRPVVPKFNVSKASKKENDLVTCLQ